MSASRLLVISGPSGVGKGTLVSKLLQDFPKTFGFSVSHTTRSPRDGEKHGVHYFFTNADEMDGDIKSGKFLEYAVVHENHYGTSVAEFQRITEQGKVCLLEVDLQGAIQVQKSKYGCQARYIFIKPPSLDTLEKRLRARNTEDDTKIDLRIKRAASELEEAENLEFDLVVENDVLQQAYVCIQTAIKKWFLAE